MDCRTPSASLSFNSPSLCRYSWESWGDVSTVLEAPSGSELIVKCLYMHPLPSSERLCPHRLTARLCSNGRALPRPPSTLPHSKEVVLALALCSVGGEASSCSGVPWAAWCYQVWWHCFSRLLCSSLKGIGPGWLQITLPC